MLTFVFGWQVSEPMLFFTSFIWSAIIAYRIYQAVRGKIDVSPKSDVGIWPPVFCWGCPLPYAACLVLLQKFDVVTIYGPADPTLFCWFNEFVLELPFFFAPMMIIFLYVLITYIIVLYTVRKWRSGKKRNRMQKRVLLLPAAFMVCMLPKAIGDIVLMFGLHFNYVEAIDSFMLTSQGLLNAIIYLLNPSVKSEYRRLFRSLRGGPKTGTHSPLLSSQSPGGSQDTITPHSSSDGLGRLNSSSISTEDYKKVVNALTSVSIVDNTNNSKG